MVGRRIGAYEIVAKVGEGGMGEVYRARDTRLNRDVVRHVTMQLARRAGGDINWTPDGRGLTYVTDDNIWMQLIDGGAPKQLTHFTDGRRIVNYAWSHDAKRLAVSRAITLSDIVMLKGVK